MKWTFESLLLVTALMVSVLPVKAQEELTPKEKGIYIYGNVLGTGSTLCEAVANNQMTRDFARRYFSSVTTELAKEPDTQNFLSAIEQASSEIANSCEDVFK